jgi:regulator of sigma E protease
MGQVSSVIWGIVSSEGEQIKFSVDRDGRRHEVLVTPTLDDLDRREDRPVSWFGRALGFVFDRPPLRKVGIGGNTSLRVAEILPNSPAAEAGVQVGDVVSAVDGRPVRNPGEIADRIEVTGTGPITLTVQRQGAAADLVMKPRPPDKPQSITEPRTGLAFGEERKPTSLLYPTPSKQVTESLQAMKNLLRAIASKSDISVTHMGGPLTIVRVYTNILSNEEAFRWVLWFSVFLNINLAVMNLLPLPVLDGGHITMALIEWIRRRPINVRVLEYVQSACVLLVLAFFIVVTLKDVGDYKDGTGEHEFFPRRDGAAADSAK